MSLSHRGRREPPFCSTCGHEFGSPGIICPTCKRPQPPYATPKDIQEWQMDRAINECVLERREVCPLNRYSTPIATRDVPQRIRDEAMEHLAVRTDARI